MGVTSGHPGYSRFGVLILEHNRTTEPYFFLTSTKADEDIHKSCKSLNSFITTKVRPFLLSANEEN